MTFLNCVAELLKADDTFGALVKFRVKKIMFDGSESYLINLQDHTMSHQLKIKQEKEKLAMNTTASVSHEMRTPLNTTISYTKLLLGSETDPTKLKYLENILHANKMLLCNINNNLDSAQIRNSQFKPKFKHINVKSKLDKLLNMVEQ